MEREGAFLFGVMRLDNLAESVCLLNDKPSKAAKQNGFARFPEDFERLRPGQLFTFWREGDTWKIETTMSSPREIADAMRWAGLPPAKMLEGLKKLKEGNQYGGGA